jgi:hypothetical protein
MKTKTRKQHIEAQIRIVTREVTEIYCRAEKSGKLDIEHLQLLDNYRHQLMTELARVICNKENQ